jgi:outer membrane protein OmpA-like peptidoglycan-associated protein
MKMKMKTTSLSIPVIVLAVLLVGGQIISGCSASNKAKGAAIGAGSGAILGGLIGKQSDNTAVGAIIGAGVGGAAGALIGDRMDKQAAELKADLKGARVERVGEGIKITFDSGLMFDFDSYSLRSETKSNLMDLAKTLNKYPDTNILIEGHTDKTGPEDYNLMLSRRRALAVADFLEQHAVNGSRTTTQGYGEEQLISKRDQENRRVEVAIYANNKMKRLARNGDL